MDALKIGAQLIGEKYYGAEERPFQKFQTYIYNSDCSGFAPEELNEYEGKI